MGRVRIIGGRWKRRLLTFPERPDLRPTPDRVRETLFNWLGPRIEGARCLDLFAGSGALGFEAASRGAAEVVMVDQSAAVAARLRAHARTLDARNVRVVQRDALAWLKGEAEAFDVVFVDPPFEGALLARALAHLHESSWLASGARVYVECRAVPPAPALPAAWHVLRSASAGGVRYYLAAACGADPG